MNAGRYVLEASADGFRSSLFVQRATRRPPSFTPFIGEAWAANRLGSALDRGRELRAYMQDKNGVWDVRVIDTATDGVETI